MQRFSFDCQGQRSLPSVSLRRVPFAQALAIIACSACGHRDQSTAIVERSQSFGWLTDIVSYEIMTVLEMLMIHMIGYPTTVFRVFRENRMPLSFSPAFCEHRPRVDENPRYLQ